jgi:hypothetical protein
VLALVIVERVEQARRHPCGISKCRMGCDILDALAIDKNFAAVAQRFNVLRAALRSRDLHLADTFRPPCEGQTVAAAVYLRRLCRGCCYAGRFSPALVVVALAIIISRGIQQLPSHRTAFELMCGSRNDRGRWSPRQDERM